MIKLENILAVCAKAREFDHLKDLDPKTLGALANVAEEAEKPLDILNEHSMKQVEEWIAQHG